MIHILIDDKNRMEDWSYKYVILLYMITKQTNLNVPCHVALSGNKLRVSYHLCTRHR